MFYKRDSFALYTHTRQTYSTTAQRYICVFCLEIAKVKSGHRARVARVQNPREQIRRKCEHTWSAVRRLCIHMRVIYTRTENTRVCTTPIFTVRGDALRDDHRCSSRETIDIAVSTLLLQRAAATTAMGPPSPFLQICRHATHTDRIIPLNHRHQPHSSHSPLPRTTQTIATSQPSTLRAEQDIVHTPSCCMCCIGRIPMPIHSQNTTSSQHVHHNTYRQSSSALPWASSSVIPLSFDGGSISCLGIVVVL